MERYAKLALVFLCAFGFCWAWAIKVHQELVIGLARFGCGLAATLWWISDATLKRRPVPYASLWIGLAWFINIPIHLVATRGVKGLLRALTYVLLFCAVIKGIDTLGGADLVPPTAAERRLAGQFSVTADLIKQARLIGQNLRPDTVDQGAGSLGALEDEIRETHHAYFWWD